jgi:hypothetical protein
MCGEAGNREHRQAKAGGWLTQNEFEEELLRLIVKQELIAAAERRHEEDEAAAVMASEPSDAPEPTAGCECETEKEATEQGQGEREEKEKDTKENLHTLSSYPRAQPQMCLLFIPSGTDADVLADDVHVNANDATRNSKRSRARIHGNVRCSSRRG